MITFDDFKKLAKAMDEEPIRTISVPLICRKCNKPIHNPKDLVDNHWNCWVKEDEIDSHDRILIKYPE